MLSLLIITTLSAFEKVSKTLFPPLEEIRRDPTEEPFEFFVRLQGAWETALAEDNTSWSGGDMRRHFCRHVGQ